MIQVPSTATSPPTAEQVAKGRDLAVRVVAAHGGLERLRRIKDSTLEGDVVVAPGPSERTGKVLQVRKDPGRFLFSLTLSGLTSTQVLDGDRGWSRTGDEAASGEDLDSVSIAGLRAGHRSDARHLLLSAADPASSVAWRGRERRDDRDTDVLEVGTKGISTVLIVGVVTNLSRSICGNLPMVNSILPPFIISL